MLNLKQEIVVVRVQSGIAFSVAAIILPLRGIIADPCLLSNTRVSWWDFVINVLDSGGRLNLITASFGCFSTIPRERE